MLQQAYSWIRSHPLASDSLLGLALLAGSADQLRISPLKVMLAAVMVNLALALSVAIRRQDSLVAFGLAAAVWLAQAGYGFQPGGRPPVRWLQPTVTDTAVIVLLYTLAAYRTRRVALAGLLICLAGAGLAISGWSFAGHSTALLLLAVAALGATFTAAWLLGDSMSYRRAYYASLEERLAAAERARDLEGKRAQAVEESAARLRRIERDLHDGAQVRLTALAMALGEIKESLAAHGSPPDSLALARDAHRAAKDTLSELRDLVRGIHPPVLDHGLEAALASLTETSALPVRLDVALTGRPSPAIEATVYFSVAELLANAVKHSGARHVTVTLGSADADAHAGVVVAVTDDGAGGARVTDGGGLAGLRERVRTVDGRISIDSPAGGPTVIVIELPGRP